MASVSWLATRTTGPAAAAAVAVVVIASALFIWSAHQRERRLHTKVGLMQRQVANVTGELSALRDETECRLIMQRVWVTDRDRARLLFGPPDENGSFQIMEQDRWP